MDNTDGYPIVRTVTKIMRVLDSVLLYRTVSLCCQSGVAYSFSGSLVGHYREASASPLHPYLLAVYELVGLGFILLHYLLLE